MSNKTTLGCSVDTSSGWGIPLDTAQALAPRVDMAHAMSSERQIDAGASARAHAEHLHDEYEALRARRSGLGRAFTPLFPSDREKRLLNDERNWRTGAQGEQNLASLLAQRCPGVLLLNDRRAPMRRGNIDHIAVAPSGVYVIDCKRYRGKIAVTRPLFAKEHCASKAATARH